MSAVDSVVVAGLLALGKRELAAGAVVPVVAAGVLEAGALVVVVLALVLGAVVVVAGAAAAEVVAAPKILVGFDACEVALLVVDPPTLAKMLG